MKINEYHIHYFSNEKHISTFCQCPYHSRPFDFSMKGPLPDISTLRPRRTRVATTRYSPPHSSVPQLQPRDVYRKPNKPVHYTVWTRTGDLPLPPTVLNNTPPERQQERNDVCQFLFNSLGNGVKNEEKYRGDSFYEYWNKYARTDISKCETLEKNCFICHELIRPTPNEVKDGGSDNLEDICFCAIQGCPKTYHTACILQSSYYCKETFSENEWICPRHYCYGCGGIDQARTRFCPTCPRSYCGSCISLESGIIEDACSSCHLTAKCMNAPEMLMCLQYGQWEVNSPLSLNSGRNCGKNVSK